MKGKKMHDEWRGMFKSFKPRSLKDYSDGGQWLDKGDKMLICKFAPIFCHFEKNMLDLAVAVFNQMGYETEEELSEILNKDWENNLSDLKRVDGGVHGFIWWGHMAKFMKKNLYLIDQCFAEYNEECLEIGIDSAVVGLETSKHGLVQYVCWTLQNWVLNHTMNIIQLWEEANDKKWQ